MSSGFVTETELAEARQRRQEEWEKVRTADQPLERPEEPFDGRSLYDRLKEQKVKKDMEYAEAHKLKNLIRGLDDDEVQFLELVDRRKMDIEKKQMIEEEQELRDFRSRVTTLQEESMDKKLQNELKTKARAQSSAARPTQKALLGVGIKRKNGETIPPTQAASVLDESGGKTAKLDNSVNKVSPKTDTKDLACLKTDKLDKGHFKCVAVLPGLGSYYESTDSEISSGSDDEPQGCEDLCKFDLLGRKNEKKKHNHQGE